MTQPTFRPGGAGAPSRAAAFRPPHGASQTAPQTAARSRDAHPSQPPETAGGARDTPVTWSEAQTAITTFVATLEGLLRPPPQGQTAAKPPSRPEPKPTGRGRG